MPTTTRPPRATPRQAQKPAKRSRAYAATDSGRRVRNDSHRSARILASPTGKPPPQDDDHAQKILAVDVAAKLSQNAQGSGIILPPCSSALGILRELGRSRPTCPFSGDAFSDLFRLVTGSLAGFVAKRTKDCANDHHYNHNKNTNHGDLHSVADEETIRLD